MGSQLTHALWGGAVAFRIFSASSCSLECSAQRNSTGFREQSFQCTTDCIKYLHCAEGHWAWFGCSYPAHLSLANCYILGTLFYWFLCCFLGCPPSRPVARRGVACVKCWPDGVTTYTCPLERCGGIPHMFCKQLFPGTTSSVFNFQLHARTTRVIAHPLGNVR